jgi:hypothetical protein
MGEQTEKINIIELLMGIKEDVSSIKTDMANFKEAQRTEKDTIMKAISDVRADYKRDLADMEARFSAKINGLQSVQNNLCGDVDTLKHAEDKKDAKRYRMTIAFIATALGGMALAKLPDFIAFCIKLKGN